MNLPPATAWLLIAVTTGVFFLVTGSVIAALALTAMEIGFWTAARHFRPRRHS